MRYFIFVFLLLSVPFYSKGQTGGQGCRIGNNIYTDYLGYAKHPNDQSKWMYYFDSNGRNYPINYNNSERYKCNYVNSYVAGSYYDSNIPPYGANVTIPPQNEFTIYSPQDCVIAQRLGGALVADGGDRVNYSVNNPTYCDSSSTKTNLPLDSYSIVFVLVGGSVGFFAINKKKITPIKY